MSGAPKPRDVDPELASFRLSEALDSCRSVVSNYRAMLDGRVLVESCRRGSSESEPPAAI